MFTKTSLYVDLLVRVAAESGRFFAADVVKANPEKIFDFPGFELSDETVEALQLAAGEVGAILFRDGFPEVAAGELSEAITEYGKTSGTAFCPPLADYFAAIAGKK